MSEPLPGNKRYLSIATMLSDTIGEESLREWLQMLWDDKQELQAEIEWLKAKRENLVAYLDEQISRWSNRNADRYWQTRRIRGKLKAIEAGEEVSDE